MQRLHEKDLCGYVEQDPSFFHLVLPAHYNPTHPFVYGKDPRRVKGELLWPEYRDEEALAKLARDLDGDREAQLEQNPRDDSTRIFPLSFFDPDKRWTEADLPDDGFDSTLISVDATFKDKPDSDDVAIAVISTKGPHRYLRKVLFGKLGFTALVETFKRVCEEFPEATAKLIEDKANGSALMNVLHKEVPGLIAVEPAGSKIARAHACTLEIQTGFFLTPADEDAHPYMPFLIDQFTNFPLGKNDDVVDAITQALNWLRMNGVNTIEQLLAAKREAEKSNYAASQNAKPANVNPLADLLKRG
jgi:predicted phage terminase large subunit-like protein